MAGGAAMTQEDQAENWLAWARTPGRDAYWSYRDAFFPLVPLAGRRTRVNPRHWRIPMFLMGRSLEFP